MNYQQEEELYYKNLSSKPFKKRVTNSKGYIAAIFMQEGELSRSGLHGHGRINRQRSWKKHRKSQYYCKEEKKVRTPKNGEHWRYKRYERYERRYCNYGRRRVERKYSSIEETVKVMDSLPTGAIIEKHSCPRSYWKVVGGFYNCADNHYYLSVVEKFDIDWHFRNWSAKTETWREYRKRTFDSSLGYVRDTSFSWAYTKKSDYKHENLLYFLNFVFTFDK